MDNKIDRIKNFIIDSKTPIYIDKNTFSKYIFEEASSFIDANCSDSELYGDDNKPSWLNKLEQQKDSEISILEINLDNSSIEEQKRLENERNLLFNSFTNVIRKYSYRKKGEIIYQLDNKEKAIYRCLLIYVFYHFCNSRNVIALYLNEIKDVFIHNIISNTKDENPFIIYMDDYFILSDEGIYFDIKKSPRYIKLNDLIEIIPVVKTLDYSPIYYAYINTKRGMDLWNDIDISSHALFVNLINICIYEKDRLLDKTNYERYYMRNLRDDGHFIVVCSSKKTICLTQKTSMTNKTICSACRKELNKSLHYSLASNVSLKNTHADVVEYINAELKVTLNNIIIGKSFSNNTIKKKTNTIMHEEITNPEDFLESSVKKVQCPSCGKRINEGAKFCNYCGNNMMVF